MATVGNLFVNVKARTAAFSKKMKSVRGTIGRLAKGFAGIAKKVALFGAAMAGIAVVAIIAMTKKGLAAVDTLAKLAQTIGGTVKSIQVLRHMATLGGVSIEKMDKSIMKMSRSIGEVAVFGIGEAADAFRELGLSATELQKLTPEKQFGAIADAINKVGDSGEAGILAYKIFGRAGQELIVTMKGGSKAVSQMGKKLKELGILIGDKQANLVEQANDAWADIGLVWDGLSKQLAVHFAPVLISIATRLRAMVVEFGGMGQVAEFIVRSFFMAGAGIMDMIKMVHVGWLSLQAGVIGGAGSVANALGELFGGDLKFIGQALIAEAATIAGEINEKLAEGWDTSRVDDYIKSLKEKWTKDLPAATMGDFGAAAMGDPAKQPTHALQTIIGSFKVEGDKTAKTLDKMLEEEKRQTQISRDIVRAIKRTTMGGVFE